MPNVKIKEIDNTSASEVTYNDYVVLVPGRSTSSDESGATAKESGFTQLYESVEEFESDIGSATTDLGFKIAKKLLKLGMKVQYVVFETDSELEVSTFWKPFEDKGVYDLRFITSGGVTSDTIAELIIKTAAERGDAVALVDVPADKLTVSDIETWIASLEVAAVVRSNETIENSYKYAAAFAPHITLASDLNTKFPGSVAYLSCFATYITKFPAWFAMAGSVRGVIPETVASIDVEFGDAANAILQARAINGSTITGTHKAVNTICNIRPYGRVIWGNRTLQPLTADNGTTGLVASSFLNVRQLCCTLKKVLYRSARKFTFEPNSDVLWTNFVNAISPILEEMKNGQGIRGYKIIKETTLDKATLKARIKIIPIEAVEDFDLTVELADSIEVNG